MIVGDIRHYETEKLQYPAYIQKGLEFIRQSDLLALQPGRIELDGDLMFALVQEVDTQPWEQMRPESHRTYVDIQFLVSGTERIGVIQHSDGLTVIEDLLAERDIVFYEHSGEESSLVLRPGQFAVFYPSDVHRPCCRVKESETIKKIVVKIHKQLWQF